MGVKRYTSEAIGTFALVFAGTGAIIVNDASGGIITHVGVALTFGLIVMTMIYAVGDVSGSTSPPPSWAHASPSSAVAACANRAAATAGLRSYGLRRRADLCRLGNDATSGRIE